MTSEQKSKKSKADEPKAVTFTAEEFEALAAQVKELEGMKEQLLRSAADYENAKKRLQRERDEFVKFGQEKLIREMLPILDNLERAMAHAGESKDPAFKSVLDGVQMVFKQLLQTLQSQGLKRVSTKGMTFDPHQHEAVAHVEEEGEDHEIIDEVQPGYFLHDRLLRAAKVRIRIAPNKTAAEKDSESESGT